MNNDSTKPLLNWMKFKASVLSQNQLPLKAAKMCQNPTEILAQNHRFKAPCSDLAWADTGNYVQRSSCTVFLRQGPTEILAHFGGFAWPLIL